MGVAAWDFVLVPYGERWRKDRRLFHSQMHLNAAPRFKSVQAHQARKFLKQLVDHSDDLEVSVKGYVRVVYER